MFIEFWNESSLAISRLLADHGLSSKYIVLLSAVIFVLCAWRLWRFTIRPFFHLGSPREVPYWIPFIGHGISFFRSSHDLIEKGLDQMGRTYEPFALQVGPETVYIVTSPEDVAEVYKKPDALGWDEHLNQLFLNFGFDPESLKQAWEKPVIMEPTSNGTKPPNQCLIRMVERTYMKQLLPGPYMDTLSENFIAALETTFTSAKLEPCTMRVRAKSRTVSLLKLCQYSLLDADIMAFFGKSVLEIDNDIIPKFLDFTEHAWMLFYGLPSCFASKVLRPQSAVIAAFQKFANLPEGLRKDQSWSVQQILVAQEYIGIDLRSRACMLMMILWAANSNVINASFWIMAHILFDEHLRETVKQEIKAAWKNDCLDIKYLCANATVLDRTFNECLRLSAGAMMGRKVITPTYIGGKLLKPGGMVLIPTRQLHSNANVWGTDHREFAEARFAKGANLSRHSSYRPFGGGVSLCPGRKFAKEQVLAFVAILLHRFDIKLNRETVQAFPKLNAKAAALGVTGPAKGMDVSVDLSLFDTDT